MSDVQFTDQIRVELLKTDFADEWVCIAARTSTAGADADPEATRGLINSLMKNRHGSPFEHMSATFRVTAPIFVWREHHRHRVGFSYNEESGRYKQLEPVFYIPSNDRPLLQVGKSMEYNLVPGQPVHQHLVRGALEAASEQAYHIYEELLQNDITREVSRMCLPVNIMSTCIVTMNARSLMNFLSLRVRDESATFPSKPQLEINLVANGYEEMFRDRAPLTYEAFIKNGRVAP